MSPFHFYQLLGTLVLPASLITDLLQLFFGLPIFLFPWGFQSRAAFGTSPSSFLNVWPIHLNFLFLISKFISFCPVTFHRSLLEIIFGHHILSIYLGQTGSLWLKIKLDQWQAVVSHTKFNQNLINGFCYVWKGQVCAVFSILCCGEA